MLHALGWLMGLLLVVAGVVGLCIVVVVFTFVFTKLVRHLPWQEGRWRR